VGTSGTQVGATLGMSDISRSHGKCRQYRVRTWLQLMCCALILELGVLISEREQEGGNGDGAESDEQGCDGVEM
jgi:hypothetical protein